MPASSRYVRPAAPRAGLALQARDQELLAALHRYRHLTSEHLAWLFFEGRSRRAAQARLRRLWEHGLVERTFIPVLVDDRRGRLLNRPVYSLGRRGAQHLADPAPAGRSSYRYLEHHLVAAELLVAIEAASRRDARLQLVSAEPEPMLAQKLRTWRRCGGRGDAVLSDGAFTVRAEGTSTFHVEIARADVRGGNAKLVDKLARYVRLHRDGFFEHAYGHARVRAVIVATPTAKRAENLRAMTAKMRHGRRFVWFTSYEEETSGGAPSTSFRPETVLDARFTDAEGSVFSLLSPETPATTPSTALAYPSPIHAI